jgi:hypothetical protein
MFPISSYLEK